MAKKDMATEYHRYMQEAKRNGIRDVNDMAEHMLKYVSLDDMTPEEKELYIFKSYCATRLTQDGYRVPLWGTGVYINPDDCEIDALVRVFNSTKKAQRAKERLVNLYKTKTVEAGVPGQYEIDWVTGGYKPKMSDEELLAKLLDDAAV